MKAAMGVNRSPQAELAWRWISEHAAENVAAEEYPLLLASIEAVSSVIEQMAPQDHEMAAAAILYSYRQRVTLEFSDSLIEQMGDAVMQLVEGSIEMTALHSASAVGEVQSDLHHENLRKMLLAMAKDVRVVVIKLAEHLERMRTPLGLSREQQVINAELTRNILAPLANRLGMGALKWQLEDLTFRALDPETYQSLSRQIELKRDQREAYIEASVTAIEQALSASKLSGEVSGRTKHLYSIWKKMDRKQVGVESLYDLNAVRILVDSVADCYAALGLVHGLWNHIPKEFDDYIANPKGNNYRSIHTAVFGPQGQVLEVQIRTHEMHDAAEMGVASHWRYKEGTRYDPGFERKIEWLRQLLEWKEELSEQDAVSEQFRDEMAEEHIYILTPNGEVVELPEGGTALDFAYTIHTGLGHRTRGAKVDGKIIPLHQSLHSGQRVEILTVKEGGPTRDWMNPNLGYLHTSRARYRVRQWFRKQDFDENVAAGRTIVERELMRAGSPEVSTAQWLARYEQKDLEHFHAAVGQGDITSGQVAGAIQLITGVEKRAVEKKRPRREALKSDASSGEVTICGVGNLMTSISSCCNPKYPDPIIGFITRSRGVTIHQQECSNALHLIETEPERVIEVSWSGGVDEMQHYHLEVEAYDRSGLLRDITLLLSDEAANIDSIQTQTDKQRHTAHITVSIELQKGKSIGRVLDQLLRMSNVISAVRAD